MALYQNRMLNSDGPGDDSVRRDAYEHAKVLMRGKRLFSDTRTGSQRTALISDALDTVGNFRE